MKDKKGKQETWTHTIILDILMIRLSSPNNSVWGLPGVYVHPGEAGTGLGDTILGGGGHMVEFKLNVCWCDSTVNFSTGYKYIILVVLLLEPNQHFKWDILNGVHCMFKCGNTSVPYGWNMDNKANMKAFTINDKISIIVQVDTDIGAYVKWCHGSDFQWPQ